MQFTAAQIAGLLNGTIEGDANVTVRKLSKIEDGVPGSISFLSNPLYTQYIYGTQASVVIINNDFVLTAPVTATLIRVESAANAFWSSIEKQFTPAPPSRPDRFPVIDVSPLSQASRRGESVPCRFSSTLAQQGSPQELLKIACYGPSNHAFRRRLAKS